VIASAFSTRKEKKISPPLRWILVCKFFAGLTKLFPPPLPIFILIRTFIQCQQTNDCSVIVRQTSHCFAKNLQKHEISPSKEKQKQRRKRN